MKLNLQQLTMYDDYDFSLNVKTIKTIKTVKASKPRPLGSK
jgi:hypothetical protein